MLSKDQSNPVLFVCLTDCDKSMTSSSGTFQSPNYPSLYPHYTICEFNISLPIGNRIVLFIDDIALEPAKDCKFDELGIYDGLSTTNVTKLSTICSSNNTGRQFISSENHLLVVFRSDHSRAFKGFNASYTTITKLGMTF